MKKIMTITLTALLLTTPAFANDNCVETCKQYVKCGEELNKKKATKEQKKTMTAGCMNGCKKHAVNANKCFVKHKNSCVDFGSCLVKAFKK